MGQESQETNTCAKWSEGGRDRNREGESERETTMLISEGVGGRRGGGTGSGREGRMRERVSRARRSTESLTQIQNLRCIGSEERRSLPGSHTNTGYVAGGFSAVPAKEMAGARGRNIRLHARANSLTFPINCPPHPSSATGPAPSLP